MSNDEPVDVDLEFAPPLTRAKLLEDRWSSWLWPAFPGRGPDARRRWSSTGGWSPPGTTLLSRFVDLETMEYAVALGDPPEPRFAHDRSLGVVQRWEAPGTLQLVADEEGVYLLEPGHLPSTKARELGWIEQAWFVQMDPLDLRRIPETGQLVLCVGRDDDPLGPVTEMVSRVGYVESLPIHPNPALRFSPEWGFVPLHRVTDVEAWRHRYGAGDAPADSLHLGFATARQGRGDVALSLRSDGRLSTSLVAPAPSPRSVVELAKWTAAPLKWARELDESPVSLAAERMRQAARLRERRAERVAPRALGFLAAEPDGRHETAPLYGATHPATGDQLVTRSKWEAWDMGYELDGLLGHVYLREGVQAPPVDDAPNDVPWGSRLGRARRVIGGPEDLTAVLASEDVTG